MSLEERKQKEKEHFNKQMEEFQECSDNHKWLSGSKKIGPVFRAPYIFCEEWIKQRCENKKVLDYGCGSGLHSIFPAKNGAQVVGVDISDMSIKICKERAKREKVDERTSFFVMDCEELKFNDDCFDIIFSSGIFSYLCLEKAFSEMARVLKPDGYVLIIDTFGYNPLLNLNRRIKAKKGLRSKWMIKHILRMKDIEVAKAYFGKVEIKFFNLATLVIASLCRQDDTCHKLVGLFEKIDNVLLKLPILQKYAFKIVVILSQPK